MDPRIPAGLPPVFSHREAQAAGLSDRHLYALRDAGALTQLGRGLFQRADRPIGADPDLLEIAHRAPGATLCLTTALARHGLTDTIPARIDVALPRGRRRPATAAPVVWHLFAADTFDIGREEMAVDAGTVLGVYGPERSIVDAFRLRHLEGSEVAVEALKRWLRSRGSGPAALLGMARSFPQSEPALRAALEILL